MKKIHKYDIYLSTALEETLGPNALDKFTSGVDDNLDAFNNSAKIIYDNFINII